MAKLLVILFIALMFESTGIVLLKKGMNQIGDMKAVTFSESLRVFRAGVINPQILLGVFFEALFFACFLVLMSRSNVSFLWPLTGLSFVFGTFAAIFFLQEQVSAIRWAGVFLIVVGAGLVSYSEHRPTAPKSMGAPPVQTQTGSF